MDAGGWQAGLYAGLNAALQFSRQPETTTKSDRGLGVPESTSESSTAAAVAAAAAAAEASRAQLALEKIKRQEDEIQSFEGRCRIAEDRAKRAEQDTDELRRELEKMRRQHQDHRDELETLRRQCKERAATVEDLRHELKITTSSRCNLEAASLARAEALQATLQVAQNAQQAAQQAVMHLSLPMPERIQYLQQFRAQHAGKALSEEKKEAS